MPNNKVTRRKTNDSIIDSALSDIYDKLDRLQPGTNPYTSNVTPPIGTITTITDSDGNLTMGTYTENGWMVDINSNFQPVGTRGFIPALGVHGRSRTPVEKEAVKYDRKLQVAIGGADKSKVKLKSVDGVLNVRNTNNSADAEIRCAGIKDLNNNEVIAIGATSSATDHVKLTNAATGLSNYPTVTVDGEDTNKSLLIKPKGTGHLYLSASDSASTINLTSNTGTVRWKFSPNDRQINIYQGVKSLVQKFASDGEFQMWNMIDSGDGADISISAVDDLRLGTGNNKVQFFSGGMAPGGGSFAMGTQFAEFSSAGGSYITHTATATSTGLKVDSNLSGDDAQTGIGLHIDLDRTVASSGTNAHLDVGLDIDVNSASLGTTIAYGAKIDVVGATSGTSTAIGTYINASGTDTNIGMQINTTGTHIKLQAAADPVDDYATLSVADTGDLTIATIGDGTTDSDLTLDIDGDIVLDAAGGDIRMNGADIKIDATKKLYLDGNVLSPHTHISETSDDVVSHYVGGDRMLTLNESTDTIVMGATNWIAGTVSGATVTEFSAANSAYAGMILGYTDIGLDEARQQLSLTTSYVVPTDEFSVSFTAPPSGNVEIMIQIAFSAGSTGSGDLYAGLSSTNATATYTQLADFHEEELIDQSGRYGWDIVQNYWTLTGLTAGTAYEYWVGFKSSSTSGTPTVQWGGSASGHNPDFIMKATALPATIRT
jgi:hypothetical protein